MVVGVPGQIVDSDHPTRADQFKLPDPLGVSLHSLLNRVAKLEAEAGGTRGERVIRAPEAGVWHGDDFVI